MRAPPPYHIRVRTVQWNKKAGPKHCSFVVLFPGWHLFNAFEVSGGSKTAENEMARVFMFSEFRLTSYDFAFSITRLVVLAFQVWLQCSPKR